jgi:hypothetical protein
MMSTPTNSLSELQRWNLFVYHAKQAAIDYLAKGETEYWPSVRSPRVFAVTDRSYEDRDKSDV